MIRSAVDRRRPTPRPGPPQTGGRRNADRPARGRAARLPRTGAAWRGPGRAGPVAAAHARAGVGRSPTWSASTAALGALWRSCRSRRARGSSPGGGCRGSHCDSSSPSCGRLRRRRPGCPGRLPGRPRSATRSCPAGRPGASSSTRRRTSSPSGRSARPSRMARPGPLPVPAVDRALGDTSRRHVGAADDRAPVDRRNEHYLLAGIRRPARGRGDPSPGRVLTGNLSPLVVRSPGMATPCPLQLPPSPGAWNALFGGRPGTPRGQAADGTFAEALSAVSPSGAGRRPPYAAPWTGRPQVDPGRGRPRPRSKLVRLGRAELRPAGNLRRSSPS